MRLSQRLYAAGISPLPKEFKLYKRHRMKWAFFQKLVKPSLTPPSWIFSFFWTVLYFSMGYASFLVWRDGDGCQGAARIPLIAYGIQLLLNWAWMPIFFGLRNRALAAIEVCLLAVAVVATTVLFNDVNKMAFQLFIPYAVWTIFATYLTIAIWRMNRNGDKKIRKRKNDGA
ncbi:TspO MBR domain containing protein [Trichuris trichiura]|uniref:TspO MBR domain containing protein n=1 Tax=Trichuris trichiura TaxID=36087 RepID=A0A077YUV1_TRITR|nr:TspO MBR domain containing protein [Trichuris trichiura]